MVDKCGFAITQTFSLVYFRKHPLCKLTTFHTAFCPARLSSRSVVSTIQPYAYSTAHQAGNHVDLHDYTELNVNVGNQNHLYLELQGVGYLEPLSLQENSNKQQDENPESLSAQQNSGYQEDEYLDPISLSQQAKSSTSNDDYEDVQVQV